MAYELVNGLGNTGRKQDEDEREKLLGAPSHPGMPTMFGGVAQPAPTGTVTPAAGASSGQFVNFDRYLNANRSGADASARAVEKTVGQQAAKAQADINTAVGAQNSRISANSTPSASLFGPTPAANNQAGQPGMSSLTASDQQLQQWANTQWRDPGSIVNSGEYANAVQSVGNAKPQLEATSTSAGLQGLLQDQNGSNGNYTAGANRLDAALTGSVGQGRFAQLRNKYGNLEQLLGGAVTNDTAARHQAGVDTAGMNRYATDELARREQERTAAADAQTAAELDAQNHAEYDAWIAAGNGRNKTGQVVSYEAWLANKNKPQQHTETTSDWRDWIEARVFGNDSAYRTPQRKP